MTIPKKLFLIAAIALYIPCITLTSEKSNHQKNKQYSIEKFNLTRDIDAVVNLCHKEWHLLFIGGDNFSDKDKYKYCNAMFENYNNNAQLSGAKVLYENDKLAGFASHKVEGQKGLVELLAVEQNFRGKGYGKILLTDSIDELHNKDINSIDICVRKNNIPALTLYKKTGFNKISNRKNIYPDCAVCLEYNPSDIHTSLSNQNSKA